jgi:hypothetical protein
LVYDEGNLRESVVEQSLDQVSDTEMFCRALAIRLVVGAVEDFARFAMHGYAKRTTSRSSMTVIFWNLEKSESK